MIWTIARKEFLTSLLTYRFAVGLVLCVVSVVVFLKRGLAEHCRPD